MSLHHTASSPVKQTRSPSIYVITCLQNGKVYVGSAVDVQKRWNNHRSDLRLGKHHSQHLQRAWDKYGDAAFSFSILERVMSRDMLTIREQWWIDHLGATSRKKGFNLAPIAGTSFGMKRTAEQRLRMSLAHIGHRSTPEQRKRKSESNRGSKSHLAKLDEAQVRQIKELLADGLQQLEIASRFSVCKSTISNIQRGQIWGHVTIDRPVPPASKRGSRHHMARLTEDQVRDIKSRFLAGERIFRIAGETGLSFGTISDIKHERTWTHV